MVSLDRLLVPLEELGLIRQTASSFGRAWSHWTDCWFHWKGAVSLNKLLVSLEGCGLIKQIAGFIGPHLVLLDRLLATLDKLLAAH